MSIALDYTDARYDFAAMKAQGVVGVIRYTKYITPGEAAAIRAADLELALVEETTATMTNGGWAAGVDRGRHANAVADSIGYPTDRPIFYAVDHDVTSAGEHDTIAAFLAGAESVGRRSEVYGEADVCDAMFDRGASLRPWQCAAWSHGRKSAHCVLFQRIDNPTSFAGVDVNDVNADDWGAWGNAPSAGPAAPVLAPVTPKEASMRSIIQPEFKTREVFTVAGGQVMHRWYSVDGKPSSWVPVTKNIGTMVSCDVNVDGITVAVSALSAYGEEYVSFFSSVHPWSEWVKVSDLLALSAAK